MSHFHSKDTFTESGHVEFLFSIFAWGKRLFRRWGLLLFLGWLLLMIPPDVALADNPTGDGLFADAGIAGEDLIDDATVMRQRFVHVNFLRFDAKDLLHNKLKVGEPLLLNLFEDTHFTAVLDEVQSNPSDSAILQGYLAERSHDQTQVTLVVKDGTMVGKIATPTGIYEIRYVDEDLHQIVQINQAAFPEEENDAIAVDEEELSTEQNRQPSSLSSTSDDGSVIDVLVLYTPESKIGAGGTTTAIESTIELAVAETNQIYQNSHVKQRLFLTHMAEVDYVEADNLVTNLSRLRSSSDAFMDHIHALRDNYHADTVVLMVENGNGFCGVAYLMNSPTTNFASRAFSVVARTCATGYYTFGHELGHNMGLNHDWYVNSRSTPYAHSHGYVNDDSNAGWRTIMSYNRKCRDQGFYCTRLPYLSNPDIAHDGVPMGVPSDTSIDCSTYNLENPACDADTHLTLEKTASIVDQFRNSETVWQGHTSQWHDAINWSNGIVPRFMDDVTIPGSPIGGHFPTIADTVTIRDLTILDEATLDMTSGTLTLLGNWREEGTGRFNGTGGTLLFNGYFDQTIQTSQNSHFHHLQIGDGSGTQSVTIKSDVTIKGDLHLMPGTSFQMENQTIYLAGDWSDEESAFDAHRGTLVLNGTTQVLRKRSQDAASWDNELTFYNLTVNSTGSATIQGKTTITNDLKINAGGLLHLATHQLSVEGTVSNYGGLEQSQLVNDGTTEFLTIKNATQSETKYYGLQITPDDDIGLGLTSVRLLGHQSCTSNPSDEIIERCFKITPTVPNPVTIRFWFTEAERNGVDADAIQIWTWKKNNNWFNFNHDTHARYGSVDRCATGVNEKCWYEWSGINHYSLMSGGSTHLPTGHPSMAFAGPLGTFMGHVDREYVNLTWQTIAESSDISFNLYRRTLDTQLSERILLNAEPILAQSADNRQHFSYEWKDGKLEEGQTFLYWLEEVNLNGTIIRHGPISITTAKPTSVHLHDLQATTSAPSKLALLMLLLLGLLMLRNQKKVI